MAATNYRDNATPNGIVSGTIGTELIVIAGGVGQGADQPCREAIVWCEVSKTVTIGGSTAEAAAGPPLPGGANPHPIVIPVSNTNRIFFAGTNGDDVYILWRS